MIYRKAYVHIGIIIHFAEFRTEVCLSTVILFWILGSYIFLHILGKYFIKIKKISAKIHEIGKVKGTFGLGMTPI